MNDLLWLSVGFIIGAVSGWFAHELWAWWRSRMPVAPAPKEQPMEAGGPAPAPKPK